MSRKATQPDDANEKELKSAERIVGHFCSGSEFVKSAAQQSVDALRAGKVALLLRAPMELMTLSPHEELHASVRARVLCDITAAIRASK